MLEFEKNELAIIFEPSIEENGIIIFKPCDVVLGTFSYDDDKFIDENLYTYAHIVDKEKGRSFAYRENISNIISKYKENSLKEIKEILLKEYSNYNYTIIVIDDENYLIRYKDDIKKMELVCDNDLIDRIYLLYNKDLKNLDMFNEQTLSPKEETKEETIITPKYLYDKISQIVIGQDDAIKQIVTTIWENYVGNNTSNMIVLGPSGVGKTEIFRQLAQILNIPLLITSVSGMSQAGYIGRNTDDILKDLLIMANKDIKKAEKAIVILDEFDKIGLKTGKEGVIATSSVQNELLKIVEDGTFSIELEHYGDKVLINTKNITFIGVGACTEILTQKTNKQLGFNNNIKETEIQKNKITPEELVKELGFTTELIGRMGKVIKLNDLTIDNFKSIILNPNKSIYLDKIELLKKYNVCCIENSRDLIAEEIAKTAINRNIGVRAIESIINEMFSDIIFNITANNETCVLEITKETVNNPKKYVLKK